MGDVDETNCAVGLARLHTGDSADPALAVIEPMLARIQNDLFDLGADLCLPRAGDEPPGAVPAHRALAGRGARARHRRLEREARSAALVRPAGRNAGLGGPAQARAVCRRAERSVVALASIEGEEVGEVALAYVNRLSDYLFVAARAANDFGKADVLWAPGAHQTESR